MLRSSTSKCVIPSWFANTPLGTLNVAAAVLVVLERETEQGESVPCDRLRPQFDHRANAFVCRRIQRSISLVPWWFYCSENDDIVVWIRGSFDKRIDIPYPSLYRAAAVRVD